MTTLPREDELVETVDRSDDVLVFAWRLEFAVDLGFDPAAAAALADSRADMHDLRRMLAAGCSHRLALRIVL